MSMQIPATCVHIDGTEHPAPSDLEWDPAQQRWVRMYRTCDWNRHESPDEAVTKGEDRMSMHPPQPDELGAQTRLDIRPTPWPWGPALIGVLLTVLAVATMVIGGWFG